MFYAMLFYFCIILVVFLFIQSSIKYLLLKCIYLFNVVIKIYMNNFRIAAMKVVKNQFNSPNSKVPNICNELSHEKNYKNFNILNNGFNFTNSHLDFQNNKLKQMQKIIPTDRQQRIHQNRATFANQSQQNRKNISRKTFQNRQLVDSSKVPIAPLDRAQKHQISHKGLQSAQPGHSTFSPYNYNDVIQNQNCYIRSQGNKIILNPKNNFGSHLYCSTKNLASQDLCNSRQLNELQMKNNMSCASTQSTVDPQIFHHKKSQNSELNSPKQLRQKKTIFRAPTFLKCKGNTQSNENKANIRSRASSSHNSMPKNFKAPELICHARDSAIHKFIQQKQNNKKISNRDRRSSMEKKIKNSLSEGQSKFFTFTSRDMKIQSYPRILQTGKQVNLRVFSKQNQNLRACLKVIKLLAENGPNSVYLVVQKRTGFLYCLKKSQVKPSQQSKQKMSENQQFPNMLSYLVRQSKIGMTLQHPLLVKTYCTLYDNKNIYQLMQYIQGSTLLSQLNPHKKSLQSSSLPVNPPSKICQILCQLLESLMYLHSRKIAHRDLKPANIFITNSQIHKIGDFGCSLPMRSGEIVEDFVGTLDYVAPQVLHHQQHGLPVDLWAIGCIAYQLWNGRPPFYHIKRARTIDNIVECRVNLQKIENKVFRDFISRLLIKQPQNRMTVKQAYNHPLLQQYRTHHNKINIQQKHNERQQQYY